MRKLYIQPSIEIEIMDATDLLAGSPTVETEEFDNSKGDGPDGTLTGGDGTNFGFAKGNNHWGLSLDSDW